MAVTARSGIMTDTTGSDSTGGEERGGEEVTPDHLDDVPDGAGCTGIWEHLSERREADD